MLSTELFFYLAIFTVINLIVWLVFGSYVTKTARNAHATAQYVHTQNKNAVSLRQIAELSAEVTQLQDAYDALLTAHKKLRARIGMRKTRENRSNGVDLNAVPADETARIAYKKQLRAELKAKGQL